MHHDPIERPRHYTSHPSGVECIAVAEHMNFCRGNAMKYLWRAGEKGSELEDLKKARWYLDREIARLEKPELDLRSHLTAQEAIRLFRPSLALRTMPGVPPHQRPPWKDAAPQGPEERAETLRKATEVFTERFYRAGKSVAAEMDRDVQDAILRPPFKDGRGMEQAVFGVQPKRKPKAKRRSR